MKVWYVITYNHLAMMFVLHVLAMGFYQFVELPLRETIRNRFSPKPQGATIRIPETAPSIRLAA